MDLRQNRKFYCVIHCTKRDLAFGSESSVYFDNKTYKGTFRIYFYKLERLQGIKCFLRTCLLVGAPKDLIINNMFMLKTRCAGIHAWRYVTINSTLKVNDIVFLVEET